METWIFSAVHELGHLVMHLGAYDVHESAENTEQERQADQFASHFLMPAAERSGVWARFNREYGRRHGRSLLKHDEPAGIDAEVYHSLFGERPVGEEPFGMAAYDFKEDRLARLVRKGLEDGAITLSRGAEVLKLPMADMRELTASWVA